MTEKTTETPEAPTTPSGEQVGEHPFVSRFLGCKHLDYEGNYVDCTKEYFSGVGVAWIRHNAPYPEAPEVVQFCKLRGRLNHMAACIGKCNAQCYEYEEVDHAVEYNG